MMLIVEGSFPLVWLLVWLARIYDYPRQAPWISREEREYLETEFQNDIEQREPVGREDFFRALLNPRTLLLALINLLFLIGQLGYLFWLPSAIERARSISHFFAGVLYTIPFLVGALALVLISAHSDKTRERRGHVAMAMAVGGVALIIGVLLIDRMPKLGFVFVCLGAIGAFGPLGPFWTIPTEMFSRKMAGSRRRAGQR